jgi:transposase
MPKGKATPLALAADERGELEKLVRRRKTAQDLAVRARIVLRCCAEGATNQAVAREAGVCAHTVGKWRERFARDRLEGLRDGPRSGAPRTVTDERVAELLVRTLETMPENATH